MAWWKAETAADESAPHILVVEDEPLIRMTISEALRELSACVIEAATADEAWDYLMSGGRADLVFTDHRMPGSMTGAQLARRVRERFPALRVILTSAFMDDEDWRDHFVPKPYDLFEVADDLVKIAAAERVREAGR